MIDEPCFCTALRRAAHLTSAFYDEALAPSGLKVTMYRLLKMIRTNEGLTLTALAEKIDLERSTLGRNISVLERRGLIQRTDQQDERACGVELTAEGEAALAAARPLWKKAQAHMRTRLGTTNELLKTLQSLER